MNKLQQPLEDIYVCINRKNLQVISNIRLIILLHHGKCMIPLLLLIFKLKTKASRVGKLVMMKEALQSLL